MLKLPLITEIILSEEYIIYSTGNILQIESIYGDKQVLKQINGTKLAKINKDNQYTLITDRMKFVTAVSNFINICNPSIKYLNILKDIIFSIENIQLPENCNTNTIFTDIKTKTEFCEKLTNYFISNKLMPKNVEFCAGDNYSYGDSNKFNILLQSSDKVLVLVFRIEKYNI